MARATNNPAGFTQAQINTAMRTASADAATTFSRSLAKCLSTGGGAQPAKAAAPTKRGSRRARQESSA